MAGKLGTRISTRAAKATSRLDDYKTPLGLAVIAVGCFLAFIAFISTTGPPFQPKYQLEVSVPDDAPVLRVGQAVRIGGKLAGLISEVEPDREDGGTTVTANITKTEFRPMPEDTQAYVRVHSIVYETYLELDPGESTAMLENEDSISQPATSGVDLLEVVELFDEETRESLQKATVNLGFGFAGRGAEANEALAELAPLSENLSAQLEAATSEPGAIERIVRGSAGTARGLRGVRSDDVAGLLDSGAATLGTVAGRSEELRRTIELFPGFEDQLLQTAPLARPLLRDAAGLAGELRPTIAELRAVLPDLSRLLSLGDELRANVEAIADVADPVLEAARPVVFELFPTMTALGPLNEDLDTLIATIEPYEDEITQAGLRLADATSHDFDTGRAPGAPAGRVVPVFTPHTCQNPIPDPGEAQGDTMLGGQCIEGDGP
jgi:phospholipid/cholesterol/gamma-HCH transport system substrate-binding protein